MKCMGFWMMMVMAITASTFSIELNDLNEKEKNLSFTSDKGISVIFRQKHSEMLESLGIKDIEPSKTGEYFNVYSIDGLLWVIFPDEKNKGVLDIYVTSSEWSLGETGIRVGDDVKKVTESFSPDSYYIDYLYDLELVKVDFRHLADKWKYASDTPWLLFYYTDTGKIRSINISYPVP